MAFPLKYVLGIAIAGTAAVVTPVVATQLPRSQDYPEAPDATCLVSKNFALVVDGQIVAFAVLESSLKSQNDDKHGGQGKVIKWSKGEPCPSDSLDK